jgi:hypothetical protein
MYVLTIVFTFWQLSVVSAFATMDTCEAAAQRARAFTAGPQSVKSATCSAATERPSAQTADRGGGITPR